jgi:hypothetical protein
MITVTRSRHVDAPPEVVFAVLADPGNLSGLLPRVRSVEVLEQGADYARVATQMAIGLFGEIRSVGDVRWQVNREVLFSARRPMPVEARWTLTPAANGTEIQAALTLDLASIIGPLAALVPAHEVEKVVGPDLDAALAALARRVEQR